MTWFSFFVYIAGFGESVQEGARPVMAYIRSWFELYLDDDAATALEYALIAGVLVATIVIGFNTYVTDLSSAFSNLGASL